MKSERGSVPLLLSDWVNEEVFMTRTEQRIMRSPQSLISSIFMATFNECVFFYERSTAFRCIICQIVTLYGGRGCSCYEIPAPSPVPAHSRAQYKFLNKSICELGPCPTKIRNHQVRGRVLCIINISRVDSRLRKALILAKKKTR